MRYALALTLGLLPVAGSAHPHVFVTADVALVVEEGALAGVRLVWTYDDFFSLLLTADLGIDGDGDMVLTPEELDILQGAVLDWPADYAGDLEISAEGALLPLAARQDHRVEFIDGHVVESHYRPLAEPAGLDGAGVGLQVFDPGYYIAYDLGDVGFDPAADDCRAAISRADLVAAQELTAGLLDGRDAADVGPEEDFPAIGDAFADRVRISCGS